MKFKDSGVEWIGEIPSHWGISKIKYQTYINKHTLNDQTSDDYIIQYIDIGNVNSDGQIQELQQYKFSNAPSRARRIVKKNDLLISTVRTYLKAITSISNDVEDNMICSTGFAVLTPKKTIDPLYLQYLSRSEIYIDEIVSRSTGVSYPAINASDIGTLECILPPLDEQQLIGKYLYKKSSEVESIIQSKLKYMALLEQQRQSIITEAVTKGLNPNVKMKDSGVEWIGEVPEHWDVSIFKRISKRVEVGIAEAATHAYRDSGIPIIRATNLKNGKFNEEELLFLSEEFAEKNKSKYIYANDLLTVRTGNAGLTGVVPESLNMSQCFTMLISTLNANVNPYFYSYYLNAHPGKVYFDLTAWGTAQKNISVPILKEMLVPVPPPHEQDEVVRYLQAYDDKFDDLVLRLKKQIEKLKEYRQSLIYEVVTGKIDVRELELD